MLKERMPDMAGTKKEIWDKGYKKEKEVPTVSLGLGQEAAVNPEDDQLLEIDKQRKAERGREKGPLADVRYLVDMLSKENEYIPPSDWEAALKAIAADPEEYKNELRSIVASLENHPQKLPSGNEEALQLLKQSVDGDTYSGLIEANKEYEENNEDSGRGSGYYKKQHKSGGAWGRPTGWSKHYSNSKH